MSIVIGAAAAVALLLAAGVVLLLRMFAVTRTSDVPSLESADVSWRDYPLARLLDPEDFEFLRSRGVSERQIQKLRRERRKILRLCLRSLATDFNWLQMALKIAIVVSADDRPELAAFLAAQKMAFYRNLLMIEGWLVLHAVGLDAMPSVDLLLPLKALQAQLQDLTQSPALAGAGA